MPSRLSRTLLLLSNYVHRAEECQRSRGWILFAGDGKIAVADVNFAGDEEFL